MNQVHKEQLTSIENALPNRASLDVEIFGMEGIPEEVVALHNQRVLTQYHQAEAERRAATGNPTSGAANNGAQKKPKFESPSDLKKRLAEHKAAKLAAEQNGGGSSGASTPISAQAQMSNGQQTAAAQQGYPGYQQAYAPPPSTVTFSAPQTYHQPSVPGYPPSGYGAAPAGYGSPPIPAPGYQQPYGVPPMSGMHQPSQLPVAPPFSSPPGFPGQPPFAAPGYHAHLPPNSQASQVGAPRAYNSVSPAVQMPYNNSLSPQNGLPQRPGGGLPANTPSLPQRPAVSLPHVNAAQFQQMHQGQLPPHLSHSNSQGATTMLVGDLNSPDTPNAISQGPAPTTSLDELISTASKQADTRANSSTPAPATVVAKDDANDEKGAKKEKATKPSRMVYSDNEISPEEKMAKLPRYSFAVAG